MKIGILTRELTLDSKAKINGIPTAYLNLLNNNFYPVFVNSNLILNNKNKEKLLKEISDIKGFILPGGNEISEVDLFIIDYCYKNNIPLLGICLGMQEIAYYFDNNTIKKIPNNKHFDPEQAYVHNIKLKRKGYLHNLLQLNSINVNSKHRYHIKNNKNYVIEAKCDKVIEAIKVKNTKYILGLQFHPETMLPYDSNSQTIIEDFLKICSN